MVNNQLTEDAFKIRDEQLKATEKQREMYKSELIKFRKRVYKLVNDIRLNREQASNETYGAFSSIDNATNNIDDIEGSINELDRVCSELDTVLEKKN